MTIEIEYDIENYKKVREALSARLGRELVTRKDVQEAFKEIGKSLGLVRIESGQGAGGTGKGGGAGGGHGGQKGRENKQKQYNPPPPAQVVVEKMYAITGFYDGGDGGDGAMYGKDKEPGEKGEVASGNSTIFGGDGGAGGVGYNPATNKKDLYGIKGKNGFLSFTGSDTSKRDEFEELLTEGSSGGLTGDALNRGDRLMNTIKYNSILSEHITSYKPSGDSRYHVYYTIRMGTMEDFLSSQRIRADNGKYYTAFSKDNMPLNDSQNLKFSHVFSE